MAHAVTMQQLQECDGHETSDRTGIAAEYAFPDSKTHSEANSWLVIGAASAVLFVGVGYTNTYGVFQD